MPEKIQGVVFALVLLFRRGKLSFFPLIFDHALSYIAFLDKQVCLIVCFYFNAICTGKVISYRSVTHLCVSWLSHACADTVFFPNPCSTFLTCIIGERFLIAGKKVRHNEVSTPKLQGPYSPTILENILCLILPILLYLEAFERNTTSDWLSHTV